MRTYDYMDRILTLEGKERFRQEFKNMSEDGSLAALKYINSEKLKFPNLFILAAQIEELGLVKKCRSRNIDALQFCKAKKIYRNIEAAAIEPAASGPDIGSNPAYKTIKWMFMTGAGRDDLNEEQNEFDAILDGSAALLINNYRDNSVLPKTADLIFNRNQKGLFIHDLVWAFLKSCDIEAVKLIAEYLLSDNRKDSELAARLLHIEQGTEEDKKNIYKKYIKWLNDNSPYLYFTGEHFQLTSDPNPLKLNPEAKYLCIKAAKQSGKLQTPLTEKQKELLKSFHAMSDAEKEILSEYSSNLHGRNRHLWRLWMQKEPDEQKRIAKTGTEGGL